jgi:hypothetical protein
MMKKITDTTVALINDAASDFERRAKTLRKMAIALDKTQEWSIVGGALSVCTNFANIRADLFVIRPTRELERKISNLEKKND